MTKEDFENFIRERWSRQDGRQPWEHLFIMTVGLAGECGEVCELVKRDVRNGKSIRDALVLELGDVIHYAVRLGQHYGIGLDEIMEANRKKLVERDATNPNAFSKVAA